MTNIRAVCTLIWTFDNVFKFHTGCGKEGFIMKLAEPGPNTKTSSGSLPDTKGVSENLSTGTYKSLSTERPMENKKHI